MNEYKRVDSLEAVRHFLDDVKCTLTNSAFDINQDFHIKLFKFKENPQDLYTTQNTLIKLNFGQSDVINTILSLEVDNYLETVLDDKPNETVPFYAFVKSINHRDIYIKIKVRHNIRSSVFCVSFHFARFPIKHKLPFQR